MKVRECLSTEENVVNTFEPSAKQGRMLTLGGEWHILAKVRFTNISMLITN